MIDECKVDELYCVYRNLTNSGCWVSFLILILYKIRLTVEAVCLLRSVEIKGKAAGNNKYQLSDS